MRFEDVCIPLDAAWSSPFVRWQGPAAELSSLDVAEQVTRRGLDGRWEVDELVLGLTVPQRQSFYGAPTLAARRGLGQVSGPMIMWSTRPRARPGARRRARTGSWTASAATR